MNLKHWEFEAKGFWRRKITPKNFEAKMNYFWLQILRLHFSPSKFFGFKFICLQIHLSSSFYYFDRVAVDLMLRTALRHRPCMRYGSLSGVRRRVRPLGRRRRDLEVGAGAIDEYFLASIFRLRIYLASFHSSSKFFAFKFICLQIYSHAKSFSSIFLAWMLSGLG